LSWPAECTEETLFHARKKQFEEQCLAQKVVPATLTSQVKENRLLFLLYSDFWFLPCPNPITVLKKEKYSNYYLTCFPIVVKPINTVVEVEAPTIKVINSEYIKGLSERALNDIEQSNYDSAITKSRTLIEEVFVM
jgi:hypothetical protein